MSDFPETEKKLEFTSVKAWLDASKQHKCEKKVLMPCDDQVSLAHGHLCSCGVLFLIINADFKKTISELEKEAQELVKNAMTSQEGRAMLAQACT